MTIDVLVVGGGPAGLACALRLGRAGLRTLVVEGKERIGVPVQCAGFVPRQLLALVPVRREDVAQRIDAMETVAGSERFTSPSAGATIHRSSWEQHLAQLAQDVGVTVQTSARVTARRGGRIRVARANGRLETLRPGAVVGADGPISAVGAWIGGLNSSLANALQVTVPLPSPLRVIRCILHPVLGDGYGWVFPRGKTANVGVGGSLATRSQLGWLLRSEHLDRQTILSRSGGLIPAGGPVDPLARGNIFLAGDAAGLAHPVTGAGIAAAVQSGMLAGEHAIARVVDGDRDAADRYSEELGFIFGRPLRHAVKRRGMYAAGIASGMAAESLVHSTWVAGERYWEPDRDMDGTQREDEEQNGSRLSSGM